MIKKEKQLKDEYDKLNQKYIKVFGEKSELEYKLSQIEGETEYMKRQNNEIRTLHQNVRQLKHDMKNHMMVIASYINDEEYNKAKEYTSEILGKLNAMHSYVETGNTLLNHIINEKLQLAKNKGIVIKAEIENLQFRNIPSIDFSALLSNMLDNAIEACEREDEEIREIHISISKCRGYETIFVKNRIKNSVIEDNPNLKSIKEDADNHGYGLKKIKNIINSCEGMYDIYEEEDFFCIKVFIPAYEQFIPDSCIEKM